MEIDLKLLVILSSAFAVFIDTTVYSVAVPILPFYVTKVLNLDESILGYLFSSYAGGVIIFTPIFGIVSDKIGRRLPMLFGLIWLAVSTILFAFSTEFYQLLLARFSQGIAASATWVVGLAIISDIYPPNELGTIFGNVSAASSLGYLVGPVFAGAMYEYIDYKSSFLLCAGLAVADFVFRYIAIDDSKIDELHSEMVSNVILSPLIESGSIEGTELHDGLIVDNTNHSNREVGIIELFLNKNICILCFTQFSVSIFLAGFEPIWALHLNDRFQSSSSETGYMFLAAVIPSTLGSIYFGTLSDKYNKYWMIAIGNVATALLFPILDLFYGRDQVVYFLIIFTLDCIACSLVLTPILPLMSSYVTQMKSRSFAQLFGLFNLAVAFGVLVGPILSAHVYSSFGFFWSAVSICAPMTLILPLLLLSDPEPKFESQTQPDHNNSTTQIV